MSNIEAKPKEDYIEDVDPNVEHAQAIMPESLAGLSEEEMRLMEKKMVRKLDTVIL